MSDYYESSFLKKLTLVAQNNDPIDSELYQKYDVKRGLRYSDGRGVLVGLTRVGDVVGYDVVDGQKVAVPGKLIYRGYDIEDIIKDAESHDQFGFEQTVYLLLFGDLPSQDELNEFRSFLGSKRNI